MITTSQSCATRDIGSHPEKARRVLCRNLTSRLPKAAWQPFNLRTRQRGTLAWTALHDMGQKAGKDLTSLAGKRNEARMRARALQLLARIPGNEQKTVEAALKDDNSDIRIVGLRMARTLKLDVLPYTRELASDTSAQVRRECAIALRHNNSPEAPQIWAALAKQHDGKDRRYLEALGIGADKQEDRFFTAWLSQVGDQWNTPAGKDIVWRSRSAKSGANAGKIDYREKMPRPRRRTDTCARLTSSTVPRKNRRSSRSRRAVCKVE